MDVRLHGRRWRMLVAGFTQGGVRLLEAAVPRPGPGEVLVRVRAVEVAPGAAGPGVPGGGFAGVVAQLGAGSFGWEVGDQVLGHCGAGAWAQFVAVDGARLAERPVGLPWEQACALAGSGRAVEAALGSLALRRGETLLVLGAGRGAGPLAVQLARAHGARVLAAAARHDHAHLRALGADVVAAAPPASWDGVDAVLVVSGAPVDGVRVTRLGAGAVGRPSGLVELWEEARVRPEVAAVLPLDRAERALRLAAGGRARGSVVLEPWPIVSFGR